MKSTVAGSVNIDTALVIVNELTLIGSRCGRFKPALRLLQQGEIEVENLIQGRLPLQEAAEAFRRAGERGTLKILLDGVR